MPASAASIDIKHLHHQTMGDRELQLEILKLYRHQARLFLCRLENAATPQELREMAHTLKGASLGIGAQNVTTATRALEESAIAVLEGNGSATRIDLEPVIAAVNEALETIEEIMVG